jgi:peptide/nickel transport system permease protein
MNEGKGNSDIVWQQFSKNRYACWSLWALATLALLAIFAPLISSNQPLVFHDGDQTIYPWFRALFNPDEPVDYVFNMALVAFLPWGIVAALQNSGWKRRGLQLRSRVIRALVQYAVLTAVVCGIFAIPGVKPVNPYKMRTFTEEELQSPQTRYGHYVLIPFSQIEQDVDFGYRPPLSRKPRKDWHESNDGFLHLLGTEENGRDVVTCMLYGTRLAITVGFVAVSIYLLIGCVLGAIAGYFGGLPDMLISRAIEVIMLFPAFFLILTMVAMIGPSIYIIMLVIGITSWPGIARLIRGEVLKQRSADYVTAAQALGCSHRQIIWRHIIPNSLSPAFVSAPFGIAGAIITEAGLSLLGFGIRPPAPSWGLLLKLGSENYAYWWLVVVPSLGIFFTVTIFNLIGNGLRDAMDPRLRATH